MKKFITSIQDWYAGLDSTPRIVLAGLSILVIFLIGMIPSFIYMTTPKYFGDANDSYGWMNIVSLVLSVGQVVTYIGLGIKNTISK